jgi:hypothetical protein
MTLLETIREQKTIELANLTANLNAIINEFQLPITLEQVPRIQQINAEIAELTAQIGG